MADREELIARLKAATGPDRELDAEIACLTKFPSLRPAKPDDFDGEYGYSKGNVKAEHGFLQADRYTASIDAALTLVPEGEGHWPWVQISTVNPTNPASGAEAVIYVAGTKSFMGKAAIPAIATAIAALKAQEEDDA